jgi:hypothetical protein
MIDVYMDDIQLTSIQSKDKHDLRFAGLNDVTLHLVLTSSELLNVLNLARMRCETCDLIFPVDIKLKNIEDGESHRPRKEKRNE